MVSRVAVSNNRIGLVGSGVAIAPSVLLVCPPCLKHGEKEPAEKHNEHTDAYPKKPVDVSFLFQGRLRVNDNPAFALRDNLLAICSSVSAGRGRHTGVVVRVGSIISIRCVRGMV